MNRIIRFDFWNYSENRIIRSHSNHLSSFDISNYFHTPLNFEYGMINSGVARTREMVFLHNFSLLLLIIVREVISELFPRPEWT